MRVVLSDTLTSFGEYALNMGPVSPPSSPNLNYLLVVTYLYEFSNPLRGVVCSPRESIVGDGPLQSKHSVSYHFFSFYNVLTGAP